ncbi:hypothetical protein Q762_15115 [Flavobacterium cauense R2A-7]|nr:hypothetical protein Q762_15115 [Flavobacterium cauense R2A-7]
MLDEKKEIKFFMKEFLKDFTFVPYVSETTTSISQMIECFNELESDTITFTSDELKHLKKELLNDHLKKWKTEILPNTKIISDKIINSKGKYEFIKEIKQKLYSFSHPIFFRNGKYCIIYEEYKCSMVCGGGTFYLFERTGENWEIKMRYCEWIH